MDDLRQRFADFDALAVPDLWLDIERRANNEGTEPVRPRTSWRGQPGRRAISTAMLAVLGGLLVMAVGGGILIGSGLNAPTATVDGSAAPLTPVLGCVVRQGMNDDRTFGTPECELVAAKAVGQLPQRRGTPFAILVRFFVCPDLCIPLRDGVPWVGELKDGAVTIEYADGGEPIELSFSGGIEAPQFEIEDQTWSGLREPVSARVEGSGPFGFTLGHCGLDWYVDFDGSFWVPVGLIDGRASALINAEQGEMLLLSPDRVQFRGESGFTAQLARFPGPKHIWICA